MLFQVSHFYLKIPNGTSWSTWLVILTLFMCFESYSRPWHFTFFFFSVYICGLISSKGTEVTCIRGGRKIAAAVASGKASKCPEHQVAIPIFQGEVCFWSALSS